MRKYKVGDIIQVLDIEHSHSLHNSLPHAYPKPYTMGVVKDMDNTRLIHLYINYHCSGNDSDTWWHLSDCVRYIPRKELRLMIAYYKAYRQSKYFSVYDFYDKLTPAKRTRESVIDDKMQIYGGNDYRVLCGNSRCFTAAFMLPSKFLFVATPVHDYIIDAEFIENYLESTKK